MVAADIDTNSAAVSSSMTSSPKCRNTATSSFNIGASLLPAGIPSTGQHTVSAAMTSCPYIGGRGLRLGDTTLGCNAALSALRAWLRCQPVVAHNSSRIIPLAGLSATDVADRGHLGHCPALGQRQPHRLGLLRPSPTPQVGAPHARISGEATYRPSFRAHFRRVNAPILVGRRWHNRKYVRRRHSGRLAHRDRGEPASGVGAHGPPAGGDRGTIVSSASPKPRTLTPIRGTR